ncbi:MAG: hypothetical protein R2818_10075 [Flavobacteriales bacterium]
MRTAPLLTALALAFTAQAMPPADFAGPNQYLCGTNTVMEAVALSTGESGLWSVVSGSAVFTRTSPLPSRRSRD